MSSIVISIEGKLYCVILYSFEETVTCVMDRGAQTFDPILYIQTYITISTDLTEKNNLEN